MIDDIHQGQEVKIKTLFNWIFEPKEGKRSIDSHLYVKNVPASFVKSTLELLGSSHPISKEFIQEAATIHAFLLRSRYIMAHNILLNGKYTREECDIIVKYTPLEKLKEYEF